MHKLFPEMIDKPDNGVFFVSIVYWIVAFIMIPFIVLVLLSAWGNSLSAASWLDIGFYIFNFMVAFGIFRRYLFDAFLNVQLYTKSFFSAVAICVILMMLLFFGYIKLAFSTDSFYFFSALPITETSALADASIIVGANPLFGTLCVTLVTPLTVSCLFYAAIFSSVAVNYRSWMAYVAIAAALLIPRILLGIWLDTMAFEVRVYLLQLPFHLLACWSYQKTDTVWAPIVSLSITNLLSSLVVLGLLRADYITII